ncbi:hypothetical protein Ssi03_19010 [Sphaerisporangium siamense]|uniref:Uncharacterized protein n=1 Tax=Sphaerisporangium siamense TaxID=795645 RepID=A0A7W7DDY9_9ACTN|nr:hypothetical protein [Sphaerisporangium siamense]MBB4705105.1 hypothetical protein [Sphaerisporangium siamense]GII83911.1 hypothetical protein Ssi03_19010 [Sphaerisporangium siamense]
MEYRPFGRTGLKVSPIRLGAMGDVPPGVTLNPADGGWRPPSLAVPPPQEVTL